MSHFLCWLLGLWFGYMAGKALGRARERVHTNALAVAAWKGMDALSIVDRKMTAKQARFCADTYQEIGKALLDNIEAQEEPRP